ncbi:MAG: outer membrane protein assembly factor BamD [Candidatus Lightella neohaematopini]|nr:outer membrane protein assembly factor BamD [Candidatus Lightella neohaematopini]
MLASILKKCLIFILLFSNITSSIGKQYYNNNISEDNKIINIICKYKKNINEKLIINNFNLNKLRKLLVNINVFIKKESKTCTNINKLLYLKGLIYIRLYHGNLLDLNKHNYQNIIYAFKIFNNLQKNNLHFKNCKLLDYYLVYTKKIILKKKIDIIKYYLHHHNYMAVINRSNKIINYINNKKILKKIKLIIKYSYLHLNIKTY